MARANPGANPHLPARHGLPVIAAAVLIAVTEPRTAPAPWTLVEGNDKKVARTKAMRTLCEALGNRLG